MESGYEKLLMAAFWDDDFESIEKSEFLSDREKMVILQYYRDQKTLKEIADTMGVSRERVRQIKFRALDGVRSTLYKRCLSEEKVEEYKIPVERFEDLSIRSRNALMRNNLRTAEEIGRYIRSQKGLGPEEALMEIRNIGRGTAKEICSFLRRKNLQMPILSK